MGGRIEAFDQAARLFVVRERERPANFLHPAFAQPFSSGIEQQLCDFLVFDRVEKAEEAHVVLVASQVLTVDLCGAATDAKSVAEGRKKSRRRRARRKDS